MFFFTLFWINNLSSDKVLRFPSRIWSISKFWMVLWLFSALTFSDGSQVSRQQEPVKLSLWTMTAASPVGPSPGRLPAVPAGRDKLLVPGEPVPPVWTVRPTAVFDSAQQLFISHYQHHHHHHYHYYLQFIIWIIWIDYLVVSPLLPQFISSGVVVGVTWLPV